MFQRMAALIRGCLHINPEELSEDDFIKAWAQTKYYVSIVHQVEFK